MRGYLDLHRIVGFIKVAVVILSKSSRGIFEYGDLSGDFA